MADLIERWMAGYVSAWESNDPDAIAALFSEDATYRFYPWADPAVGSAAIVARWLDGADAPDDHAFSWSLIGSDGGRRFVQGRTVYTDGRTYENLWIVDLREDGRATAFTEWYMESASKALGPHA
ncbi:nuclear transport factor 2 family protein [Amnibacterium kyonggiense]|uniref:SnoaL-like protein n=1 Tax=Amnibacterium kyonggiense TaxID=595671 RepID=A0A4R7FSB1_9MICO|nr:nuclear transport factor 2 family protein [Amnibacterium kyonggiense]TDS80723.1 SnoaL-like protein [Amnibacterium kyonggiense]